MKTNAQNSELDPQNHPSGARIEKMNEKAHNEKGHRGETLRPSERESSYIPTQDKPEGNRSEVPDAHRRTPETRES